MKKILLMMVAGTLCCSTAAFAQENVSEAEEPEITASLLVVDTMQEAISANKTEDAPLRIVIRSDELISDYGAAEVVSYPDFERFYLVFDDEDTLLTAYEQIKEDYGEDGCYRDEIHKASEILLEDEDDSITDPTYSWGVPYMGLDEMRDIDLTDVYEPVTVAVIDTGIIAKSPLFDHQTISSKSYDFTRNTSKMTDKEGHGTHVAGIISDCCPSNVTIMALRVFDDDEYASDSDIELAVDYAIKNGADVINMSLGDTSSWTSSETFLDDVLADAASDGIPVVCAAGNDAVNVNRTYPACNENTIAVSALKSDGEFDDSYSNYGNGIDFAAPGSSVESASVEGGTVTYSGTSMASPHLASIMAYLKMLWPDASVDELYEKAVSYCVDLGEEGKDEYYGNGCPNLSGLIKGITENGCTISGGPFYYEGTPVEPELTVRYAGEVLTEGQDYTVSIENNDAVGTGKIIVTGKGDYVGKATVTFKILSYQPKNLTASVTDGGIQLDWKAVGKSDKYYVYRSTDDGSYKKIASVKENTYTDTSVSNGIKYSYKIVNIYDGDQKSKASSVCSYTYLSKTTVKVNTDEDGIKVSWAKNSKASGYILYRKAGNEKSWTKLKKITNGKTVYEDSDIESGITYAYKVKCYVTSDKTTCYSVSSSKKSILYIEQPYFTLSNGDGSVKIRLHPVDGADKLVISRRVHGTSEWTVLDEISDMSVKTYEDDSVKNGKSYDYTVKAVIETEDKQYESTFDEDTWICYLDRPAVSSLSAAGKGSVNVSWKKNSSADGYQIAWSVYKDFSEYNTVSVTSGKTVSKTLTDLKKNKTCYVKVRAYHKISGKTSYSAWSKVKNVTVK